MSVNLEVSVQKEDGDHAVLLLTGFTRGITHSASVEIGETVIFRVGPHQRLFRIQINDIQHEWQAGGSEISLVSTVLGESKSLLREEEFQSLLAIGFKEI